ncbi:MAG: DEAD/DEAH box helicase [Pseudomonadota bacterium]|nr:DEAD/DEAH box helicase [Pseudomonadota bacterium]
MTGTKTPIIPAVTVATGSAPSSGTVDSRGMRPMQALAYSRRGEQYLLIKSPPASGKSRALMFVALDKLHHQGLKKAIIVVPERSIGASFRDEELSAQGFFADWRVAPRWNLCDAPGGDAAKGKVKAFGEFLKSDDRALVCTHATFRFAVDELGVEALDDCLIAVDEFHHVSAHPDNRLGAILSAIIGRGSAHVVAMTGSYFRGDGAPVLSPEDEQKFETVTYTYHQQLAGYAHLKSLSIRYCFYSGSYLDQLADVLDPAKKTIVHIPSVNARESTKEKVEEANAILSLLGEWQGIDGPTGFHRVKAVDGRILKVADLVDDDPKTREKVAAALRDPKGRKDRDHVDVIIALGMAKEGFDWIWCEHALTVGYRSSLTEIVQIIGRATRDAPGKAEAVFTNFIAEPDASEQAVTEAVNDTLKAIAASLLMEQVLAPRFDFTPKNVGSKEGFDYGENGYVEGGRNVGYSQETGQIHMEIGGFAEPSSLEAQRICREDLNELLTDFIQTKEVIERGLFDHEEVPEQNTVVRMGKIVRERYPDLTPEDQEAVRQQAIAAFAVIQEASARMKSGSKAAGVDDDAQGNLLGSTAFVDGVRRFAMDVRELDIDLIDSINPFGEAYSILSRAMDGPTLERVETAIAAKKVKLDPDEARDLARRALVFKKERGRSPSLTASDPYEQLMAQGVAYLKQMKKKAMADGA